MVLFVTIPGTLPMLHSLCPGYTRGEDNKDSWYFPQNFPVPKLASTDTALQAVEELAEVLKNTSRASPFAVEDKQIQAIKTLQ